MSSFNMPEKFIEMLGLEMKAQGLTEEGLLDQFSEDFPQIYFVLKNHIDAPPEYDDDSEWAVGFMMASCVYLGYKVGYVRRVVHD